MSDKPQVSQTTRRTLNDAEQEAVLEVIRVCGRLGAIVNWCVENSGETLGDNPRQLAIARKALADLKVAAATLSVELEGILQ